MDEPTPELDEQERARAGILSRLTRPIPFALAAVSAAALLSLLLWLFFFRSPEPEPAVAPSEDRHPPVVLYEETAAWDLEDKVKQADLALLETMRSLGGGNVSMRLLDAQVRHHGEEDYHFQSLRLGVGRKDAEFLDSFRSILAARLPEAQLGEGSAGLVTVSIDGVLTHELHVDGVKEKEKELPPPSVPGPKLTIVIDDMGEHAEFARALARLSFPVTFSIWPNAGQSRETAAVARKAGREVLAHVPMQPKGWPGINPGPQALYVSMDADEIRQTLRRNLDRLPEAVGINNHMGSRFTESAPGMGTVMDVLAERGLFYLDSVTSPRSVGAAEARQAGLRAFKRDVFLDNERNVQAIIHQLRLTESLARRNGRAIAIGHPHPETLEALAQWAKDRDGRIAVVPLSGLR